MKCLTFLLPVWSGTLLSGFVQIAYCCSTAVTLVYYCCRPIVCIGFNAQWTICTFSVCTEYPDDLLHLSKYEWTRTSICNYFNNLNLVLIHYLIRLPKVKSFLYAIGLKMQNKYFYFGCFLLNATCPCWGQRSIPLFESTVAFKCYLKYTRLYS